jgi:glycosyltransferase involved in cell wall biosynthesis
LPTIRPPWATLAALPEPLTIAQVTPYPWEAEHEVNAFVRALATEQAASGHRVVVLAPSHDPDLVRESRRRIRAGELFDPDGGVRVLGVGELLPLTGARRGTMPAPPLDISRTIEEALTVAPPEFVHVHEPFAPSASSVALRHSRSLNIGTFHAPAERVLSTQVARRFVELFFGRLDARTASFEATRELMQRIFPADYRVLRPGVTALQRPPHEGAVRIAFVDQEERAALRLFLRALRRLPTELEWEATVFVPSGAAPTVRSRLLDRVHVLSEQDTSEDAVLASADVVVAASHGVLPSPGLLVRALGAGAVPVASHLGSYEEVISPNGADLGLLFEAGDVVTLAAQLERLIRDDGLLSGLRANAQRAHDDFDWSRVAQGFQALYDEVAARRHPAEGNAIVAARLADRPLIDVDLHMHTDHSSDCATPVDVLLATARDAGLGAIAVTDHNEISGAHDARAKAAEFGVKVIVAEEIKTADQGEVIGLFIEEKIPRGMTLAETIAEIKRQGGLVYVPHPFDRMHSVPDYEHLLAVVEEIDALEVFNARVAIAAFNEEAVRFAAKYRIVGGAGSDAHVPQGLGSVRIRMRDFDGPEEFLESLRAADIVRKPQSLLYVQALKFLQTKATPPAARRAARQRRVRKVARNQ